MTITTASIRRAALYAAGFTVVCLVISASLGSSGTIDGDPDLGQQIANVFFPGIFLGLLVLAGLAVAYAVTAFRERRRR